MKIKYIAEDGTEFDNKTSCEAYEWELNIKNVPKEFIEVNGKVSIWYYIRTENQFNAAAAKAGTTIKFNPKEYALNEWYNFLNCYYEDADAYFSCISKTKTIEDFQSIINQLNQLDEIINKK